MTPGPPARPRGRSPTCSPRCASGDLLVHHPYDSFSGVGGALVEQAVNDPDVLAIKMTVYRTSDDSAAGAAADPGRREGQAGGVPGGAQGPLRRAANIHWARALEEAGAHVVYGLPGLKTHAKALLVVRREGDGVRHYVHIGTGNYHAKTARLYEDFGLFTTRRGARRRRGGHVQLPDRLRAAAGATARCWWRPSGCATRCSTRSSRRSQRPPRRARRADRDEDERAGGPALHPRPVPRLAGGRARSTSTCAASAASSPAFLGSARTSAWCRWWAASWSTRASTASTAARRPLLHRLRRPDAAQPGHARGAADPGACARPRRKPGLRARRGRAARMG